VETDQMGVRQQQEFFGNQLSAQQQAAFGLGGLSGLGGLGGVSQGSFFGVSDAHRYAHRTSIEYELQNDLDKYLEGWDK
jgi:hypothetical protein